LVLFNSLFLIIVFLLAAACARPLGPIASEPSPEPTQETTPSEPVQADDVPRMQSYGQGSEVRFERISVEQGLSQNTVSSILQDSRGFLWIGTSDGLNRYDGTGFKVYRHDPLNPTSLSHNVITALAEDEQGMLWIGTDGGGLNQYDRHAETRFEDLLRQLADATTGREGLPVDIKVECKCDLPADVHIAFYRLPRKQ
jgi:hypothetical protein